MATVTNQTWGTYTALTVTNLQSLASDDTDVYAGWQSARIDFQTALKPDDVEFVISLPTAATAPAGTSAVIVYLVPWVTTDGGTTWVAGANFGTVTLPSGAEGLANMSDPNSMRFAASLPYKITSQTINGYITAAALCGGIVPDAISIAVSNRTGAALSTGCVIAYRPITYTHT